MLRIITSLTLLAVGLFANAQVKETRTVSPFTKIEITDGVELIFTQNDNYTLRVETTDGIGLSSLKTSNDSGVLKVSCKGNGCEPVKVYVTSPVLAGIKASKNAHFAMTNPLHSKDFSAMLTSGATFNGIVKAEGIASLKAKSNSVFNIRVESDALNGNFQSGARVNLSGKSKNVKINTGDDALCNARNFITDSVSITAGDTSHVMVSTTDAIQVIVAEFATVKYFGFPSKVSINPEAIASSNSNGQKLVAAKN